MTLRNELESAAQSLDSFKGKPSLAGSIVRLRESLQWAVLLDIKGEFAEFGSAQTSPNKSTFESMSPSAASNLVAAVMGKTCQKWIPLLITAFNLPRKLQLTKNEPQDFLSTKNTKTMQISHTVLRDVHYQLVVVPYVGFVSARETPAKFQEMLLQRLARGEYHKKPCLGTTPCFAQVSTAQELEPGHSDFNSEMRLLFGRKMTSAKKGLRTYRHLWASSPAQIQAGTFSCRPWECLGIDDLTDYLTLENNYFAVKEDGTYQNL